jgi:hypothetical protein
MAFVRPSMTTAPDTPPPREGSARDAERPTTAARPSLARVLATGVVLAIAAGFLLDGGCSSPEEIPTTATTQTELVPGAPTHVDLDADGTPEQVLIDAGDRSLLISDGAFSYRSRDKWRIFQAVLGDTDRDGLTEVVTLLDSVDGRHLGLFAYFGGEYRERLVTQEIIPTPLAIQVTDSGQVVLIQEPAAGETAPGRALLRWNGFGFTRIEPNMVGWL